MTVFSLIKNKMIMDAAMNGLKKRTGYMKQILIYILLLVLSPASLYAACTGSSPTWYSTPDYSSVNTCVSNASVGDTINVSSGTATWSSTLTITKPIILQGAGIDSTTITGNVGNDPGYNIFLIKYIPSNPSSASNVLFRITGFTFDANNDSRILRINIPHTSGQPPIAQNKIRIDNNKFLNTLFLNFYFTGLIYGVVDSNVFQGKSTFELTGLEKDTWNNETFLYGTGNAFFIEDNTFTITDTTIGSGNGFKGFVFRYNTVTYTPASSTLSPWVDAHGDSGSAGSCVYVGVMGVEIYGNSITGSASSTNRAFTQRGGKALMYFNNSSGFYNSTIELWEEYADIYCPTNNSQPSHVSDSYYWNNRKGTSGASIVPALTIDCSNGTGAGSPCPGSYGCQNSYCLYNGATGIKANTDWWNYNASFDGTTGVGCGTLASRPATCTTGVGYWATNQSCSSVDSANIGANPTMPISGTLYKCTATNTWTPYYTPYTYPHPLRTIPLAVRNSPRAAMVVAAVSLPQPLMDQGLTLM